VSAVGLLTHVGTVLEDRRAAYGDPKSQMQVVAQRWSITLGTTVTPAQVALCMIDLKLTRLAYDPGHVDSVVDVIGYAALLREVR